MPNAQSGIRIVSPDYSSDSSRTSTQTVIRQRKFELGGSTQCVIVRDICRREFRCESVCRIIRNGTFLKCSTFIDDARAKRFGKCNNTMHNVMLTVRCRFADYDDIVASVAVAKCRRGACATRNIRRVVARRVSHVFSTDSLFAPTRNARPSKMKMSKVGNQTNSQDPQAVNSRVFVGNLNTFQCSKTDVERMFQRYGRLAGISMHKGFAFVQFTNPFDARSACVGEDARTVLGQTLDVNLVAEPKPHQTGRKRQNLSKTGNDWEYYYNSYYAASTSSSSSSPLLSAAAAANNCSSGGSGGGGGGGGGNGGGGGCGIGGGGGGGGGGGVKSSKRQKVNHQYSSKGRNHQNGGGGGQPTAGQGQLLQQSHHAIVPDQLKLYSNPDILICGNCREMFTELQGLLDHKKEYCKLRFTCKCNNSAKPNFNNNKWPGNLNEGCVSLMCVQCKESFDSAWDLMVHAQAAHMINVYQLTTRDQVTASPLGTESENGSTCSVGAQVNIDEDGNGSADESLSGRNEYEPADNNAATDGAADRVHRDEPPALNFGVAEKELADNGPLTPSCQTCLIQQPIQALMGVH
ncbi:Zinc finger C2H2-type,RNA recognition motif domain [Cinara cedri]|uniref:Zinc finger C2H2-type,RNA recognition motif domain n=1 Tax=Cinara cedri TaxID=506608 RepID=A0A5E4NBC0_9HEMI|nr:Zinc finger C2H2-type,RNA recognition motif domain [Cinara cedri]